MKLPADEFCIWLQALPRYRLCRAWQARKPIQRGPLRLWFRSLPAGPPTLVRVLSASTWRAHSGSSSSSKMCPGAGGTTGSTRAMRAKADGYTILMGHMGTHAVSVSLYPNLAYKPDVDFEPIGVVIEVPVVIVARNNFPANDLKEFMAYVR